MPLKKVILKVSPADAGKRLDQYLAEALPGALGQPLSKAKVRKLIVAGAVYLNRSRVRIASKNLLAQASIEIMVDLQKLQDDGRGKDLPFQMGAAEILFEDEFLIAVNKPAGLPTQPTLDEARDNLFAAVKKFLARRGGPVEPYVGLHHRLDRDTSGVLLFTLKKEANAGVAEIFAEHHAQKVYQALATRAPGGRAPQSEWSVENYLGKSGRAQGKRALMGAVRSGGDFARTEFRLLAEFGGVLHVEARPKTGRTHQIRVHLAEDGMPILGDGQYGATDRATDFKVPRIMLHAASLTFPHPIHKTEISVHSPLPEDFVKCLQHLRQREQHLTRPR